MRLLLGLAALAISLNAATADLPPLQTVENLDLARYQGRWYEIARLENRFQKACAGDVRVSYSLLDDGRMEVVNQCSEADGALRSAEGMARKAEEGGPASRLQVRFAPAWLSFLPMVWGDYHVIDLAEDYSWAVVGHPERTYFWILSRKPTLDRDVVDGIVKRAQDQGYDLSDLVWTKHGGIPGEVAGR